MKGKANQEMTCFPIKGTARSHAELKKGALTYLGDIDLQEYFIVGYDMFDSVPDGEWDTMKTQVDSPKEQNLSEPKLVTILRFESHLAVGLWIRF